MAVDCGAVFRKTNLTGSHSGAADGAFCLVADVRLDNRAELGRSLNLEHPEELADSAFLMAAWERWGPACLDHVVGGFAFAVWAPARQELFAARDHAGERAAFLPSVEGFVRAGLDAEGTAGTAGRVPRF